MSRRSLSAMPDPHADPDHAHLSEPVRAVRAVALGAALGLVLAFLGRRRQAV